MTEKIGTIKNPLTIIAIFAGIAEASGTLVLPFIADENQLIFIYFLIVFPSVLIVVFFLTLNFNNKALYAPSDFNDEENYIKIFKYDESKQEKVELNVSQDEMLTILNENISDFKKSNDLKFNILEKDIQTLKTKNNRLEGLEVDEDDFDIDESLIFDVDSASITHFEDANKLQMKLLRKGYETELYGSSGSHITYEHYSAIWLGIRVSFKAAKEIILTAKEFYPHLKYISLSDENRQVPEHVHYQVYIGGSTTTAKEKGLKPLNKKDWEKFKTLEKIEELHNFLLKK